MRTRFLALLGLLVASLLHAGEGRLLNNGIDLYYNDTGNAQGEPVVLVHGFAVNSGLQWTMPGITKALTDAQYRVILFDNRGHGRSTRPKEADQYGMPMVHDIKQLMDHLNIKKAHIVGYSMGAFLTHKFAATYPERVKSITLGGAGWLRDGVATDTMENISTSLRTKKSLAPLFLALHPINAKPLTPAMAETNSKLALLINDVDALAGVAQGMKQLKLSDEEAKKISVPTLCMVGERDPLIMQAKLLEGVRPKLKMVYLPKAHHMNTFELPIFRENLLAFLKEQQ